MKVLVNGGLNLSELDGWWAEAYDATVGWAIGDGQEHDADPAWDWIEAQQLYDLLEREIAPAFYTRDARGIPTQWVVKMRESMAKLAPFFSSNRMVRQYVDQYYLHTVHLGEPKWEAQDGGFRFEVPVYLGEIAPEWVRVELYADPLTPDQLPERLPLTPAHPLFGAEGGFLYVGQVSAKRPIDHYTARVVPYHEDAQAPLECAKIAWQR